MTLMGMMRQDKRCYVYDNQSYNTKELKSKAKRCRKVNSRYIKVVVEYQSTGQVKLFFSRFSRQGQWQLLLTTDLSLTYIKAMEIYSLRWGIEVLLKECKQHLNLESVNQTILTARSPKPPSVSCFSPCSLSTSGCKLTRRWGACSPILKTSFWKPLSPKDYRYYSLNYRYLWRISLKSTSMNVSTDSSIRKRRRRCCEVL